MATYKEIAGTDADIPIYDIQVPNSREQGVALYAKGPWILDQVRSQMGKEDWLKCLQIIYRDYKGKIFAFDDFYSYIEKYGSHEIAASMERQVKNKGLNTE